MGKAMIAAALAVTAALAWTASGAPAELEGPARVIDGDTVVVGRVHVRLRGIDAPELAQLGRLDGAPWPCGAAARQHLIDLIGTSTIRCVTTDHDRYGRALGRCFIGQLDLGAVMVLDGYAWAHYGHEYDKMQTFASRTGAPLWRGSCQPAWEYRHGQR